MENDSKVDKGANTGPRALEPWVASRFQRFKSFYLVLHFINTATYFSGHR
jgi:hypothetical protein